MSASSSSSSSMKSDTTVDRRAQIQTLLNEQGYDRDHIEMQLAHADKNSIRGTYNHAQYLDQRRAMLQAWADWLDELKRQALERERH